MAKLITIYCKNTKEYMDIPCGTSLKELYDQLKFDMPYPVIAARVNYKVQALNFLIYKPKDIQLTILSEEKKYKPLLEPWKMCKKVFS